MKLFSLSYQSTINPSQIALGSVVADTEAEAMEKGMFEVINKMGDHNWKLLLINSLDLEQYEMSIKNDRQKELEKNENWVINKIIERKDNRLFKAVKPYLNHYEKLFIENKLSCKQ